MELGRIPAGHFATMEESNMYAVAVRVKVGTVIKVAVIKSVPKDSKLNEVLQLTIPTYVKNTNVKKVEIHVAQAQCGPWWRVAASEKVHTLSYFSCPYVVVRLPEDRPRSNQDSAADSERGETGSVRKAPRPLPHQEEAKKKAELVEKKDYWLRKGIIVKITMEELGDKFFKKKGVVKEVIDCYTGVIKVIDSGAEVKVDQDHLETVIPGIGKPICIVNGDYRGVTGRLHALDEKNFSVTVKSDSGKLIEGQAYEDVCKYSLED